MKSGRMNDNNLNTCLPTTFVIAFQCFVRKPNNLNGIFMTKHETSTHTFLFQGYLVKRCHFARPLKLQLKQFDLMSYMLTLKTNKFSGIVRVLFKQRPCCVIKSAKSA